MKKYSVKIFSAFLCLFLFLGTAFPIAAAAALPAGTAAASVESTAVAEGPVAGSPSSGETPASTPESAATPADESEEEEGLTDRMARSISGFLEKYLPPEAIVFIVSLMPILELRGGMIVARLFDIPWVTAMIISIIANMIPVPFIILFIERILNFLKDHGPIKKLARSIEEKGRKAGTRLTEKYPRSLKLGLLLFVAIPLPGTGAWTGSLAAALLGLKPKESAPYICLGVLGASLIMSVITYLIPWLLGA